MASMAKGEALPTNHRELAAALLALDELPLVERARRVRALDKVSRAIIAGVGDEAIFLALHEVVGRGTRTYAELARELGVSVSRINHAVTAYRQRAPEA